MKNMFGRNWKRYLVSTAITFFAVFFATLSVQLQGLTAEAINGGLIAGGVVVAIRTAFKVIVEGFMFKFRNS